MSPILLKAYCVIINCRHVKANIIESGVRTLIMRADTQTVVKPTIKKRNIIGSFTNQLRSSVGCLVQWFDMMIGLNSSACVVHLKSDGKIGR